MPIEDSENKKQYTADGIQTTFPFPYKFFNDTDLQVYVGTTPKTLSTDYSVVGIGSSFENGGNVVFVTAPAAGSVITIVRVIALEQPTDYKDYANFPNEQFNSDLDRQVMISQQLQEQISRQLVAPVTDPVVDMTLPTKEERASTFLAFDSDGKPIAAAGMSSVPVSTFMATVLDDLTLSDARETLDAGVHTFTPLAGYTPAAGDVVELCSADTIRKAKRTASAALASGSAVVGARVARLDATHFCVLYAVGLAIYAQVWVVDQVTLVPTAVAAATLVYTCTTTLSGFDICPIDATHVLVCYALTGGGASFTQGYVRSLTLDVGTGAVTVNSTVNTHANTNAPGLYAVPGSANIAMMWLISATSVGCCIISGGASPAYNVGAARTLGAATTASGDARTVGFCVSSSGLVAAAVFTRTASPCDHESVQFSISGTTVTGVSATDTLLPAVSGSWPCVEEGPAVNRFFMVSAISNAGAAPFTTGIINLTKESLNTIQAKGSTVPTMRWLPHSDMGLMILKPIDRAKGVFVVHVAVTDQGTGRSYIAVLKRNGGPIGIDASFALGDFIAWDSGASAGLFMGMDVLSSGTIVCAIATSSASGNGSRVIALRRSNTVIGIALDATGKVQTEGVFITTGLTPGAEYGVDDNGDLSASPGEVRIGVALSATKLGISMQRGI